MHHRGFAARFAGGLRAALSLTLLAWGAGGPRSAAAPPEEFPPPRIGLKAVFGRNGNDHGGDPEAVRALAGNLVELGVTLTRVEARWTLVEAQRGHYDFSEYDRLTEILAGAGIEPMFMIYCAPPWAMRGKPAFEAFFEKRRMRNLFTTVWPADTYLREFEEFCYHLARRYRGVTSLFEFWCEPDGMAGPIVLTDRRGNPADIVFGGDTVLYVRWLRACHRGIKRGNPEALVAAGSLSVHDLAFLTALYAQDFQHWCDAVSLHPYAEDGFDVRWVTDARTLMLSHGDWMRPIWLTEFGWEVRSEQDAEKQCAGIRSSFAALAAMPYVTQAYFFTVNDWRYDEANPEAVARFGLVNQKGERRPGFALFGQELRRFMRNATPRRAQRPPLYFTALPGHFDPAGCVRFSLDIGVRTNGTFSLAGDMTFGHRLLSLEAGRSFVPVVARRDVADPVTARCPLALGPWKSAVLLRPLRSCPFRARGALPSDLDEARPGKPALVMAWNRTHLFLRAATCDPDHSQPHNGNNLDQGDCLLVALDPARNSPPGARYLADDQEYLLARTDTGPCLWRRYARQPSWIGAIDPADMRFSVERRGAKTIYELDLPWTAVPAARPRPGTSVGLAVALFDLGPAGRTKRILFGGGVLEGKEPAAFGILQLRP